MEDKWPEVSQNHAGEVMITFPMNRPYETKVIELMWEAGFIRTGSGYHLLEGLRQLFFEEI